MFITSVNIYETATNELPNVITLKMKFKVEKENKYRTDAIRLQLCESTWVISIENLSYPSTNIYASIIA